MSVLREVGAILTCIRVAVQRELAQGEPRAWRAASVSDRSSGVVYKLRSLTLAARRALVVCLALPLEIPLSQPEIALLTLGQVH